MTAPFGWIVKTEPETYAFDRLLAEGTAVWDGVRNHQAAAFLRAMQVGDPVLVYHSGAERAAIGLATVSRSAFPDPTDAAGRFPAVELTAGPRLAAPVPLSRLKAEPALAELPLIRQSRLSVSPVGRDEWTRILALAGPG